MVTSKLITPPAAIPNASPINTADTSFSSTDMVSIRAKQELGDDPSPDNIIATATRTARLTIMSNYTTPSFRTCCSSQNRFIRPVIGILRPQSYTKKIGGQTIFVLKEEKKPRFNSIRAHGKTVNACSTRYIVVLELALLLRHQ